MECVVNKNSLETVICCGSLRRKETGYYYKIHFLIYISFLGALEIFVGY